MLTMGTFVVIIDPLHHDYGNTGKIVGLMHTPPSGVRYTVNVGMHDTNAYDYQLSTSIQDAIDSGALDIVSPGITNIEGEYIYSGDLRVESRNGMDYPLGTPTSEDVPLTYDHRSWDGLQKFLDVELRKLDRELLSGCEFEHINLPPITNEVDGTE